MTMSELEIVADYRAAKNKAEQIKIMAELNLCGADKICAILASHPESGFTADVTLPNSKRGYNRKPKDETPAAEPVATVKADEPTAAAPTPQTTTTLGAWLRSVADILDATPGTDAVDLGFAIDGYWLNINYGRISV